MEIQYSEKAKFFKPNIFNILNERKAKIAQKGVKVYDLFVGTPDFPPAEHVMKVVQEIWIKPYEQLAGANFIRSYSPKKYVLVGSPKYNPNDGTITLGEAEGGRKIVLYRLNWFDLKDRDLIHQIMKTVHH